VGKYSRQLVVWTGLAVVASLVACGVPGAGAPPARATQAAASIWPARWPVAGADAKGIVRPVDAPGGLTGFRLEGGLRLAPRADELAAATALVGEENAARVRWEGDGAWIYRPRAQALRPDRAEYFVFVSGRGEPDGSIPVERTWFAYLAPEGSARGVALLMPGLFGTPQNSLELCARRLRAQGWGVLRMMSQPSRFNERVEFMLDAAEPDTAGARMAAVMEERGAECAYAVEGAFRHLAGGHSELATLPRIAVGMSGGAMTLPTVAAREPEKYAAAVLIAGGCDFFAIARETTYVYLVDSVRFRWTPAEPSEAQIAAIDAAYLARAPLDSYHTAAALRGKPMLMIHGDHDMAVPARLGDVLWERLGRPERWVQTAGHEEVFFKLPAQMDRIMEWIGAHTGVRPDSGR
jgi:predicted esterase